MNATKLKLYLNSHINRQPFEVQVPHDQNNDTHNDALQLNNDVDLDSQENQNLDTNNHNNPETPDENNQEVEIQQIKQNPFLFKGEQFHIKKIARGRFRRNRREVEVLWADG